MAGCRALGLIDKVVTGPLWRKLKDPSISVLKMSHVYSEMKNKLTPGIMMQMNLLMVRQN